MHKTDTVNTLSFGEVSKTLDPNPKYCRSLDLDTVAWLHLSFSHWGLSQGNYYMIFKNH